MLVHLLLVKIYPLEDKLPFAAHQMYAEHRSGRIYAWLRLRFSRKMSEKVGAKHHNYGITLSDKTKSKMSKVRKGEKHWNYGKHWDASVKEKIGNGNRFKERSQETKDKIAKTLKGRIFSEETKEKIRKAHIGEKFTQERKDKLKNRIFTDVWKQKISEAKLGKPNLKIRNRVFSKECLDKIALTKKRRQLTRLLKNIHELKRTSVFVENSEIKE